MFMFKEYPKYQRTLFDLTGLDALYTWYALSDQHVGGDSRANVFYDEDDHHGKG